MGKKRMAVLVGCNYPKTQYELHGCINDVVAMRDVLVARFGFDPSHIELLTDAQGELIKPTGVNIKFALNQMVDKAEAGDVLFFHYSGHGTWIPSHHHHAAGGKDEAIVPCDFNLITDVDFRHLVNRIPKGAIFTIFSDSCHSGGLIDKEKEQIGPSSSTTTTTTTTTTATTLAATPKTIPFEAIHQHLAATTGIDSPDVGTHLVHHFGDDASLRFRLPLLELNLFGRLKADEGILLSGCQANETSADMDPGQGGGKAYGAFSYAVQSVLRENPGPLSNREVLVLARKVLQAQRFQQHPCLYCSDENADATFLLQPPSEGYVSGYTAPSIPE